MAEGGVAEGGVAEGGAAGVGIGGAADKSCEAIQATAKRELMNLVAENRVCQNDDDCVTLRAIGNCFEQCNVSVTASSEMSVITAARAACVPYDERGCDSFFVCPYPPSSVCVAGICSLDH